MIGLPDNEDRRLRMLARHAGRGDLLDIGFAQQPNPHLAGAHVTGLDLAPPPPSPPYDEVLVGDADDLAVALGGRTFDGVVAGEVIEHLENPYRFLRACRAALRPGGVLVLSTPNPLHPPVLLCEALGVRRFFYTTEHRYYFLPRWVERMLTDCGLIPSAVRGVGYPLVPFGRKPVLPAPVPLSYHVVYVARPG